MSPIVVMINIMVECGLDWSTSQAHFYCYGDVIYVWYAREALPTPLVKVGMAQRAKDNVYVKGRVILCAVNRSCEQAIKVVCKLEGVGEVIQDLWWEGMMVMYLRGLLWGQHGKVLTNIC